MKIETIPVCKKLPTNQLNDKTVIVIDVLRASTNMVWALQNGAIKVIPTVDPGEAAVLYSRLGARESVLAGERGGIKLADFDIGNSPIEYESKRVKGKNVIMSTSNGTAAVCAVSSADTVLIGAMINRTAAAKKAVALGQDVLIFCAGTDGHVSADDLCAAGAIVQALCALTECEMSDLTKLCKLLYTDWKEGRADLSGTFHYSRLVQLGFAEDVRFCLSEDITDYVPVYKNGTVC